MTEKALKNIKCRSCGGELKYSPGTKVLICNYCQSENDISSSEKVEIIENVLDEHLFTNYEQENQEEVITINCKGCAAITTLESDKATATCAFCGSEIIFDQRKSIKKHKPQYLLPFNINKTQAEEKFKEWLKKLWFAPNDLKDYSRISEILKGLYIPYWTYDCNIKSDYSGRRGEDYQTTETYTATENGETVTKERTVTKIRWANVSGSIQHFFDDLLVIASKSIPHKLVDKLEPWDLKSLVDYQPEYLSGFITEIYQINVKDGFDIAKEKMKPTIEDIIRKDIGGDHQEINNYSTNYSNMKFKHILLPLWISAYRYSQKTYQFVVNARTGEVQGERPYSIIKIILAVIVVAIIIGCIIYFF